MPGSPGTEVSVVGSLNWIDLSLLIVVVLSAVSGFSRGLVRQVCDLLAWLVSIYLAYHLGGWAGHELDKLFGLQTYFERTLEPLFGGYSVGHIAVNVIGFILVLVVARVGVQLVAGFLDMVARLPVIATFNRLGGALFGLLKGAVIVFLAASLLAVLPEGPLATQIDSSFLLPRILAISPTIYEHLRDVFDKVRTLV